MSFDEYTPEKIEEEIRAYLQENYQIDDIVYINPTYNIFDLYSLTEKFEELQKCQMLVTAHCKEIKISEDDYQNRVGNDDDGFPKRKLGTFSSEVINPQTIKDELKVVQD